jgi:hypothetical protein
MVKRNKRTRLASANRKQNLVLGTLQVLLADGHYVMAGRRKKLQPTTPSTNQQ